jgi:leader peptidase (prepilin peptidase) / N-methyltransferase
MNILILIIIFIFGTDIGSFLNVLIDRLPINKSPWQGRSKCDYCKKTLSPIDLIPIISFLFLKGKCRYCHKKLSVQYPFIECLTGSMFVLVFIYILHFFNIQTIPSTDLFPIFTYLSLLIIFSSFLVIFVADIKFQIIPDELIVSSLIGTLMLLFIQSRFSQISISGHLFSALGAGGLFLAIYLLTKGRGMGFGDVKLVPVLGLFLGFPKIIVGIYSAFLTGAIISLILLLFKKKKLKSKIAFGPFLLSGTIIAFFYGGQIWDFLLKYLK